MITKDQAIALGNGTIRDDIHCEVVRRCKRTVGPRGGVKESYVRCRPSGRCKTWKTRPAEFRLPVKHGLYESSAITEANASDFHLASGCPALEAVQLQTDRRIAADLQRTIDEQALNQPVVSTSIHPTK